MLSSSDLPDGAGETLIIIGAILAMGIVLGALVVRSTSRIDNAIAQADSDRRVEQSRMDEFRREMRRLEQQRFRPERIHAADGAPRTSSAD